MRRVLLTIAALCAVTPTLHAQLAGVRVFGTRIVRADQDESRALATLPPFATPWHHTRNAPRIGNGRLFHQRAFTNTPMPMRIGRTDESARYGATPWDNSLGYAKAGTDVIAFTPWERFPDAGYAFLNDARHEWLDERGFTGGVRTFVSPRPAPVVSAGDGPASAPRPAGRFRLPADIPRTRSTEQVRYSLPPGMDPALAARLAPPVVVAVSGDESARD